MNIPGKSKISDATKAIQESLYRWSANRYVKTIIPVPNNPEKKTEEKLDTPKMPYARAISQKGRGGFSKEGLPP
jgi:hypothetical protein